MRQRFDRLQIKANKDALEKNQNLERDKKNLADQNANLNKKCDDMEKKMRILENELIRERVNVEDLKQKNANLKDNCEKDKTRFETVDIES